MNPFNPEHTVSEHLVAFVRRQQRAGVPAKVRHEALRLLINQLKASVGACTHPAIGILHDWARETPPGTAAGTAHVLGFGTATTPMQAAVVNGALFEVLDFNDPYIPTCWRSASSANSPARPSRRARDSGMHAVADITSVAGFARGFYERPDAQAQLASMRETFSRTTPDAFIAGTETIACAEIIQFIHGTE